jgi:hypothetical protein
MTRREQLGAEANALRAQGLTWREIGEQLGLHLHTIHDYATDPTGEKARARKAKNDGACVDCGARTVSSGSRVPPERCHHCACERKRAMSRKWIIDSINEWADLFGAPPTATDWNPAQKGGRLDNVELTEDQILRLVEQGAAALRALAEQRA